MLNYMSHSAALPWNLSVLSRNGMCASYKMPFFFSYRIWDSWLECSKNMIQVGLCVIVISEFGHRKL